MFLTFMSVHVVHSFPQIDGWEEGCCLTGKGKLLCPCEINVDLL